MTGEQMYRAHKGTAEDLGIHMSLPPWEDLHWTEHQEWEQRAMEQTLRDRVECDTLYGERKD